MYEFDSVSVSAFEAAELSGTLTEKSAEGWEVAGIVNAGSDVVAYLRRATGDTEADDTVEVISEVAPVDEAEVVGAQSASADGEPAAATSASATDLLASGTSSGNQTDSGGTGWGSGTGAGSTSSGTSGSAWGGDSAAGAWSGSSQQASAPPVQQTTPSVPAGWYADPAGRYELRYWDGGAWTEHVSRAGQQYTDPPVA